jgi:hypothetical protein
MTGSATAARITIVFFTQRRRGRKEHKENPLATNLDSAFTLKWIDKCFRKAST